MTSRYLNSPNQNNLKRIGIVFLILFMMIALALAFWGIVRAGSILSRPDNPRLVENELRIQRGSILDRNNNLLAYSRDSSGQQQRIYPYPNFGPAVGFYSINLGTSGSESGFDPILRNDPDSDWQSVWQDSLHPPQVGNDVKLAIDSGIQETAIKALNNREGAALLLELEETSPERIWVRTLANSPTYDANTLEEQFDSLRSDNTAPLLNRATQGQYQPGLLLQPFIIAHAIDQGIIQLNERVEEPSRMVEINGQQIGCQTPPPNNTTWADVLRGQCPGPMLELADQLGITGLDTAFSRFGLNRDPSFEIDTITIPDEPINDPLLAGIGQDNLSVTPYQIGLAMSALTNDGFLPQGQIGLEIQSGDGSWQPWRLEPETSDASSAFAANAVKGALPENENLIQRSTLVLSGLESMNAWFTGILDLEQSDYVVVIVLEGEENQHEVEEIGHAIMSVVRN